MEQMSGKRETKVRVQEIRLPSGREKRARVCLIVMLFLLFLLAVSNIMHGAAGSGDGQRTERESAGESSGGENNSGENNIGENGGEGVLARYLRQKIYQGTVPLYAFADESRLPSDFWQAFFQCVCDEMPILSEGSFAAASGTTESKSTYEELIELEIEREQNMLAEAAGNGEEEETVQPGQTEHAEASGEWGDSTLVEEMVLSENQSYAAETAQGDVAEAMSGSIALRTVPSFTYDFTQYQELSELVKGFYIVDPTTTATADRLNITELLGKDMTMQGDASSPQILIYHTHSQEGYADSVPGDVSTGVVGAGEYLAQLLREQYGFQVIHHTGQYDVDIRDMAYSYAEPAIQKILEENPTIEVVIDLHRDEVKEDVRLVTDVDGRPTARFMFFNGLSYNNTQGDIAYLYNPYIKDNLAFSFQAQVLANEYYPGVSRGIYLRAMRYNMHFRPKNMLIELGAQTNTQEEIWNAVPIIAQILGMELSGTH